MYVALTLGERHLLSSALLEQAEITLTFISFSHLRLIMRQSAIVGKKTDNSVLGLVFTLHMRQVTMVRTVILGNSR